MRLTTNEARFLTALAREQNQRGCKGPAHDLLRRHAFPGAPLSGPNSLAFSYSVVPLTNLLLKNSTNLEEIDGFLQNHELIVDAEWPWDSVEEFSCRLREAQVFWANQGVDKECKAGA